jgi:cytochrome c oxidase subunit II
MNISKNSKLRRVLIASSHPLFAQGLRSLLHDRYGENVKVVGVVSNLDEAVSVIEGNNPDLVVVDYDDEILNREEFLARFVEGEKKLRLVLLSLQSGGDVLVYDRRSLSAAQIDDWFDEWTTKESQTTGKNRAIRKASEKDFDRRKNMKHFFAASFLVLVLTVLLILGMNQVQLLPEAASAQAEPIDRMFEIQFIIIYFLFSLIIGLMIYSVVVFRRKKNDQSDAQHIEGSTRLEILWTTIPLLTVIVLAFMGSQALADTLKAEPKPLEIKVVGQQWLWRFEYPDYGIISSEMVVPVERQALLKLSSVDVIHSFWVPEFRVKQDALPGGEEFVRELRITPINEGEFTVRCAELCGTRHAYMLAPVKVVSAEAFDIWVAEQMGESTDPIERGQKVWDVYCKSCHTIDGTPGIGPTWYEPGGAEVILSDDSVVPFDENYARESILDPNAKIVKGYAPGLMPLNFGDQLTERQIDDVIAFKLFLKR